MKMSARSVFIWLCPLLYISSMLDARTQQTNAPAGAGNVQNGKVLFLKKGCYECHGTVGQGGTGPRLAPNPLPVDRLIAYVRKPMGMPPYSPKVMSDAELADVRAYLSSIPPPPPLNTIPLLNDK
jgi:ubiquinol-cytochrome c reductase cytochrome c subunit